MKMRLLVLTLVAMLTLGVAGGAMAADAVDVQLSVVRLSTDEVTTTQISGLDDDGELFVPAQVLFLAVDVPYVVRGGDAYFPVGNRVESVDVESEDGVDYVPAIETLNKLGIPRELANGKLTIQIW